MPLNVKTGYGAVGNYNPATGTGADDTTAFVNGIAAAVSTGEQLFVPQGNYKITSTIGSSTWAAGTGARLYGEGTFATNIYFIGTTMSPPGGGTLLMSGQNSFLRDIGFVAQKLVANMVEIGYSANNNVLADIQITGCRFGVYSSSDSFSTAIYCSSLTLSTIDKCVILGNSAGTFAGNGIYYETSVNDTVTNCRIQYVANGVYVSATSPGGTQGVLISSNIIFGTNTGISINSINGDYTSYISVVNNIIDFCRSGGIYVSQSGGSIANNYIGVDQTLGGASAGIYVALGSSLSIVGNTLEEYSGAIGQNVVGIGVLASSAYNILSSNTVTYFNTGIYIDGTASNTVVTSNIGRANYTNFLVNNSTTTSLNNNIT